MRQITDMETWLLDNGDRLFEYDVFKRMFTPHEQNAAYSDEDEYRDKGRVGTIEEAVDLGGGNWLLGIRDHYDFGDDISTDSEYLEYYLLSEIRLSYRSIPPSEEDYDE